MTAYLAFMWVAAAVYGVLVFLLGILGVVLLTASWLLGWAPR